MPAFDRRVVSIVPGHPRTYDASEWRDAIVVLARGRIELECVGGGRYGLSRGAVLWLQRLPLRAIHSRGREPAVLIVIRRRRDQNGPVSSPSSSVSRTFSE
jgi:hypothetical protein